MAVATLDLEHKTFIVYVIAISIKSDNEVHPLKRAQIAYLKTDKTLFEMFSKYTDFVDIFSPKMVAKLLEYMKINNHTIELINNQQPLYSPIYSLGPVELEILKVYIKNNLANGFIRPFKFPAGVSIFFDKKLNGSLRLCLNY